MNHIKLALEGKVDFVTKTNPFGSGDKNGSAPKPEPPVDKKTQQAQVAMGLLGWAMRAKARQEAQKKEPVDGE